MTYVTALLPMPQGVSVYAALKRAADTCGDGRSRGQVMADTLVERVTGRAADVPTPIAVNLVLTDETLLGGDSDAGPHRRLRARSRPRSPATLGRRRRRRPAVPGHAAQALRNTRPPERWWRWNHGRGCFPKGLATFIGTPRRHLPHPVLRRPDPPHRPRQPRRPRRAHHRRQRAGTLRSLQLRQRSPRLAGTPQHRRKRHPHHRTSPPPPAHTDPPKHHRNRAQAASPDQRRSRRGSATGDRPARRLDGLGLRRREAPVVGVLRRIHHRNQLTHGRPAVRRRPPSADRPRAR